MISSSLRRRVSLILFSGGVLLVGARAEAQSCANACPTEFLNIDSCNCTTPYTGTCSNTGTYTGDRQLQAAVNKVQGCGGGTVYVPPKPYTMTNEVVINGPNVTIVGDASGKSVLVRGVGFAASQMLRVGTWPTAVTGVELAQLTIDGARSGDTPIFNLVSVPAPITDLWIHDCRLINSTRSGLVFQIPGTTTPYRRVRIERNHVENIGERGMILRGMLEFQVADNTVIATGDHGIIVGDANAIEKADRGVYVRNYVKRGTLPTPSTSLEQKGFLFGIGTSTSNVAFSSNIGEDNRCPGGAPGNCFGDGIGDDGFGWSHNLNQPMHENIVVNGNISFRSGAFGLDPPNDSVASNNLILDPGTVGIVIGNDKNPDYDSVVVASNTIVMSPLKDFVSGCPDPSSLPPAMAASCMAASLYQQSPPEAGVIRNLTFADNICTAECVTNLERNQTLRIDTTEDATLHPSIESLIVVGNHLEDAGLPPANPVPPGPTRNKVFRPISIDGDRLVYLVMRDNHARFWTVPTDPTGPPLFAATTQLASGSLLMSTRLPRIADPNPPYGPLLLFAASRSAAFAAPGTLSIAPTVAASPNPFTATMNSYTPNTSSLKTNDNGEVTWEFIGSD